jgi:hypothetical protein
LSRSVEEYVLEFALSRIVEEYVLEFATTKKMV